jgi:hypothetical protein
MCNTASTFVCFNHRWSYLLPRALSAVSIKEQYCVILSLTSTSLAVTGTGGSVSAGSTGSTTYTSVQHTSQCFSNTLSERTRPRFPPSGTDLPARACQNAFALSVNWLWPIDVSGFPLEPTRCPNHKSVSAFVPWAPRVAFSFLVALLSSLASSRWDPSLDVAILCPSYTGRRRNQKSSRQIASPP